MSATWGRYPNGRAIQDQTVPKWTGILPWGRKRDGDRLPLARRGLPPGQAAPIGPRNGLGRTFEDTPARLILIPKIPLRTPNIQRRTSNTERGAAKPVAGAPANARVSRLHAVWCSVLSMFGVRCCPSDYFPQPTVPLDLLDHLGLASLDERDDLHLGTTRGAAQAVRFVNLPNQRRPPFPGFPSRRWTRRGCDPRGCRRLPLPQLSRRQQTTVPRRPGRAVHAQR